MVRSLVMFAIHDLQAGAKRGNRTCGLPHQSGTSGTFVSPLRGPWCAIASRTAKRDEAQPAGAGLGVQPCQRSLSHDH